MPRLERTGENMGSNGQGLVEVTEKCPLDLAPGKGLVKRSCRDMIQQVSGGMEP